jgi:nitrate/nitrite-specific signal transduction histidine kinase
MVIRDLTEQHRLQQDVQGHLQQLATMQERERLAREFHDGLAQTLAYLNIQASQIDQALARADADTARTQLGEMRLVIQSAYRDVRHALYDLRVSLDHGLGPALEAYCQSFGARNSLDMHYTGTETGSGCLGPDQAAQVLRIVQEALTNVRKHSRAQGIWVNLAISGETLKVTVKDNGVGFVVTPDGLNAAKPGHYGLVTMRERTTGIGGTLTVRSEPGAGTEIELAVPCRAS